MRCSPTKLQISLVCVFSAVVLKSQASADEVDFTKDVRPILEENCWYCHGEDEQESGLRLDRRANMLQGGDYGQPALVPGKPGKSYLLQLVRHDEDGLEMPPDEDKLPDKTIELLTRWIKEGAIWPGQMNDAAAEMPSSDHWAFQPVKRTEPPADAEHPIDAFLNSRLDKAGLAPNAEADPRTLIRRASIVLTGLVPTPEEADAFIKAHAENPGAAYDGLVSRLLDSPHFGERWAQHWLDVIRWAETNGSESNLYRKNAWVYRDYVIRSFNEDRPYDQFVREQLAGDTMGSGEALGFLVAGPHVPAATVGQEESAIRQARADRMDEIMQTVGASLMGLTVGCARCHNHKFDPLTISDYYSMTAVFQDIEFGSRRPEFPEGHPREQRGRQLWKEVNQQRDIMRGTGPWVEDWGGYRELHFPLIETRSVRVSFKTAYVGVDELEIFGPAEYEQNLAHQSRGTVVSGPAEMVQDGRNKITRVNDGEYGTMAWRGCAPKDSKDRPWVRLDFERPQTIDRLRISSNREYYFETDYLQIKSGFQFNDYDVEILEKGGEWRTVASTWYINNKLNKSHPDRAAAVEELERLRGLLTQEGPRPSFVGRFVEPVETYVFHRGSPESPGAEMPPAGPAILAGSLKMNSESPGADRRRKFAEWMVQPTHPLTARVMVNRIWHHVFGAGIVATTADFGAAGAEPTYPELLDWLAAEFMEPTIAFRTAGEASDGVAFGEREATAKPWSVKSMVRLMVTSDAFRRSNRPTSQGTTKDARSVFLWRYPPRRVEAEVIRDSILQASGSLDRTMGGRGYRIHNVKKTYAQWEIVDNCGPDTWRRMIYQERMRRVDDRMFTAFDFPDCGQIHSERPVSTTPLQALNLMNSEFVVTQARFVAQRAEKESSSDNSQAMIRRCFQLLLNRNPDPGELTACAEVLEQAGLPLVCRSLINSNEFAFLP